VLAPRSWNGLNAIPLLNDLSFEAGETSFAGTARGSAAITAFGSGDAVNLREMTAAFSHSALLGASGNELMQTD
jgi:hypothetical protein